eukprot:CAMPEP_0114143218 /NCGR_PEP_ID=MMETSP0043_2-20121206/18865_1 /TAXON_ID=464988 /ORGANISM="Hemiselmis andersenii, Strain CCMP644" /LENGTH=129 /DNA_ID=CAMNT_0001237493 /DNA_START=9 /DNA_END=398 /DNA_ORIENTATION=-
MYSIQHFPSANHFKKAPPYLPLLRLKHAISCANSSAHEPFCTSFPKLKQHLPYCLASGMHLDIPSASRRPTALPPSRPAAPPLIPAAACTDPQVSCCCSVSQPFSAAPLRQTRPLSPPTSPYPIDAMQY